jgi:hypothetical protein
MELEKPKELSVWTFEVTGVSKGASARGDEADDYRR